MTINGARVDHADRAGRALGVAMGPAGAEFVTVRARSGDTDPRRTRTRLPVGAARHAQLAHDARPHGAPALCTRRTAAREHAEHAAPARIPGSGGAGSSAGPGTALPAEDDRSEELR